MKIVTMILTLIVTDLIYINSERKQNTCTSTAVMAVFIDVEKQYECGICLQIVKESLQVMHMHFHREDCISN